MKTKADPRHQRRISMMKFLFGLTFNNASQETPEEYTEFISQRDNIDQLISKCAPEWPLDQINRIDLSILRLAIFELQNSDTPHKVIIDEAIELAKEYGSENSSKFVNGVMGTALDKIEEETS